MDEIVFNASRLASCPWCDVEGDDDEKDDDDDDDDEDDDDDDGDGDGEGDDGSRAWRLARAI